MSGSNQSRSRSITNTELEDFLKVDNIILQTIFDEINMGIIFIDYKKKTLLLANTYFKSMVKPRETIILEPIINFINKNIENKHSFNLSQDLKIRVNGKMSEFGFTTYRITNEIIVVLLSEIASKSIYIQSQQENQFYDKLSELVAEIAHEIGNPLSGINMSLQVLGHNISIWPQEKIKNYIDRTISEINRLSVFLKRIRDISNENKLEMKTINLKSIIDDVYKQNEEILKQKRIVFKNQVEKNILIFIDNVAFFQIILNLLKNSLHILKPKNEIFIYVDSIDDYYIKLVYRNNGKPIPEDLLDKIFSPFYTTKDRGDGIGLSISLKLMTRMGGTIKAVQPEDGKGAKFVIYIPNKTNK
ncbi:MAG: HAMP domain-containing histidine kinase [Candidatus Aminicenantes bacterium]|nr:HAMP domain-containing histidine kinase [Candidatus Aminicenantes bacterium]